MKREIRGWALTILAVLAFRTLLYEAVYIPSGSMIPTLQIGDYVVVEKWAYGARLPFTDRAQAMWAAPKPFWRRTVADRNFWAGTVRSSKSAGSRRQLSQAPQLSAG